MRTRVPNVLGMNFQAVSVGQKLVEASISTTGGYMDVIGTPSNALAGEIKFVDSSIGAMVSELKAQHLFDSTTIIITAKHGQSPIDPKRVLRIPADDPSKAPPSSLVATTQALEDDVSLLWLPTAARRAYRAPSRPSRPTPQRSALTAANSISGRAWD